MQVFRKKTAVSLLFFATAAYGLPKLQTGSLPGTWLQGAGNCLQQPDWLVHQYNEDFFILRQSGCTNYEKPFLYLLFGRDRAMLLDTGAGDNPRTAEVVADLLKKRETLLGRPPGELVVLHSHGHKDHTSGDAELSRLSNARLIPAEVQQLRLALGIQDWPAQPGTLDLGKRVLDIMPIPGHEAASIAIYDRTTGILLTGDSLYPGRLYVSDWNEYRRSIARLTAFTRTRPIAHVLGTHIEQTRTPFRDYPTGTTYQPSEHALDLSRGSLLELDQALGDAGETPVRIDLRDFSVVPKGTRREPFVPVTFNVPALHESAGYKLVPLGPSLAQHDYNAYMSSIEHLRKTFSGSGSWPNKNITMADALKDVEGEEERFQGRVSFTYAVLTPDCDRELGCVYIRPSRKAGYDAEISMWVTDEQFRNGLETELMRDVKSWLAASWPYGQNTRNLRNRRICDDGQLA